MAHACACTWSCGRRRRAPSPGNGAGIKRGFFGSPAPPPRASPPPGTLPQASTPSRPPGLPLAPSPRTPTSGLPPPYSPSPRTSAPGAFGSAPPSPSTLRPPQARNISLCRLVSRPPSPPRPPTTCTRMLEAKHRSRRRCQFGDAPSLPIWNVQVTVSDVRAPSMPGSAPMLSPREDAGESGAASPGGGGDGAVEGAPLSPEQLGADAASVSEAIANLQMVRASCSLHRVLCCCGGVRELPGGSRGTCRV